MAQEKDIDEFTRVTQGRNALTRALRLARIIPLEDTENGLRIDIRPTDLNDAPWVGQLPEPMYEIALVGADSDGLRDIVMKAFESMRYHISSATIYRGKVTPLPPNTLLIGRSSLEHLMHLEKDTESGLGDLHGPDIQLLVARLREKAELHNKMMERQILRRPAALNEMVTLRDDNWSASPPMQQLLEKMGLPQGFLEVMGTGRPGVADKPGLSLIRPGSLANLTAQDEQRIRALAFTLRLFGFKVSQPQALPNQIDIHGDVLVHLHRLFGCEDGSLDFERPLIDQMREALQCPEGGEESQKSWSALFQKNRKPPEGTAEARGI